MKTNIYLRNTHQLLQRGLMGKAPGKNFVSLASAILTSTVLCASAVLSTDDQITYAQRFRPYIKTTLDGNNTEPHHPCNWQWLVGLSDLVTNYVHDDCGWTCDWKGTCDPWPDGIIVMPFPTLLVTPYLLTNMPWSDVRGVTNAVHNGSIDLGYALHLFNDSFHAGEAWTDVVHAGHGIYAHVEEVPNTATNIINIEYTILWAYNEANCSYHNGDITTITVVYDRHCDLLTRVTYDMHGRYMQTFRILGSPIDFTTFYERDINNAPTSIGVAHLYIPDDQQYLNVGGSDSYTPAANQMFLAPDPVTLRYEHPAGFAEYGSHELWPNQTGSSIKAPAHWGDGICFLPDTVQVLGTLQNPDSTNSPFLFYNGKMGTDPQGIILHKAWFWPDGRTNNPYGITRFSDDDPYEDHANMPWPPRVEPAGPSQTVYVNLAASPPYAGDLAHAFNDLRTAFSFLPKGARLSVAAGPYFGCGALSRPCTIVATGGTVTLLGPGINCQ